MSYAFETTEQDIVTVLEANTGSVQGVAGRTYADMAQEIFADLNYGAVEKAALRAGTDMDDQIRGAQAEIKSQLIELGVLLPEPA